MTDAAITITFDPHGLHSYTDAHLAMLWHVAQANPAPHGDYQAGEIASRIGSEIIRRWLGKVPPEMHHHQQRDNYWKALTRLATYEPPAGVDGLNPDWHNGQWVPKNSEAGA
jgi:hypothetical protein